MNLKIASDLSLPPDAHTQTIIVYGGKGMGKTNLAAVFVEELQRVHARFCYLDPVGVAWGIRHGRTRRDPGLTVLALGGIHGDIPIEPTAGAVVADLVVDETVDVLIDISRRANGTSWSQGEKIRFVADYMTRLYERQGEKRRPIMQVIDEAGRFVPQQIPHGAVDVARCSGSIEQVVELGRNVGIGVTLITQRSARMAKAVSELAECMISFRIVGPNSIAAVVDWFGDHIDKHRARELVERLRSLDRGEALVVAPGWLKYEGVIHVRARHTFDSSATPRGRNITRAPTKAQPVDLAKYRERMKATIEQAEANDAAKLRRTIAELRKQLSAKESHLHNHKVALAETVREKVRTVKVPIMTKQERAALVRIAARSTQQAALLARLVSTSTSTAGTIDRLVARLDKRLDALATPAPRPPVHKPTPPIAKPTPAPPPPPRRTEPGDAATGERIVAGMRTILATLKQYGNANRARLGLVLGINAKGTTITAYLQRLRRLDLITEPAPGEYALTPAGAACVVDVEPVPTDHASLVAHWQQRLGSGGMRTIFDLAVQHDTVTRTAAGEALGINAKGTTVAAYFQRLARLGVLRKIDTDTYQLAEDFHDETTARFASGESGAAAGSKRARTA